MGRKIRRLWRRDTCVARAPGVAADGWERGRSSRSRDFAAPGPCLAWASLAHEPSMAIVVLSPFHSGRN